ncbi:trichohyalin-like isoform X2, partial [Brachionus plicatilis]
LQKLKIEQYQSGEKNKENALNVEKIEKALVKDINEELRKLSSLIPGQLPKIVSFSNLRASFPAKFTENSLTLSTFQMAFNNLRNLLDEVSQSFQSLKTESEQVKRVNARLIQEKDEELEMIKKKCEKQKQKELESIREFINKDNDFSSNYNTEINSLVNALKNKDKEIKEIQDNMAEWKKETLTKLADKFEIELNRELDKRMKEYKEEASNHQNQLEKLRKEIDNLMKECRQNNANQISQEQHERMIRYLQSRLNDLRDENLVLRDRYKSTNLIQSNIGANNYASSFGENEFQSRTNIIYNQNISKNPFLQDDDNLVSSMYSSSIDGDENLESRNEILQQKLKELQKLQVQLDNVQA